MIHGQAFLKKNCRGMNRYALSTTAQLLAAGEREVVRITGVLSAHRFCQAAQATIRTVKAEIGKQWGCRRALGKMPPRVERALLRKGRRDFSPDVARSGCSAECAEEIG